MLQILNKESAFVRYKTVELIRELKEEECKIKTTITKGAIECKFIQFELKFINILRKEEKGEEAKELRHDNLIVSIKSEIELLYNMGSSPQNF